MRILLDECVPRPLKRELPGHVVATVTEMGWSGRRNGELLRLMAAERFDVLLTVDQNVEYQQNLSGSNVGVVVMAAPTNRLEDLLPLMARVREVVATSEPGRVTVIR